MKRHANWIGSRMRHFRWMRLRFEWGRYHYMTNSRGDTLSRWWVWEGQ